MVADVEHEGRVEGVHYWNGSVWGIELDLTGDQSSAGEALVNARRIITRRNPTGAGEVPFQLLRGRVAAALRAQVEAVS